MSIQIKVGPKGGALGDRWDAMGHTDINAILIHHGNSINSFQIASNALFKSGVLVPGHSGDGDKFDVVDLGSHKLSWVSGHYGHHMNDEELPIVIRSLKLGATRDVHGVTSVNVRSPMHVATRDVRGITSVNVRSPMHDATRDDCGVTSVDVFGPFGCEEGTPFYFKFGSGKFFGFHGRSDDNFLHAIGVYVVLQSEESRSSPAIAIGWAF